jgi:hypothetical protein
VAASGRQGAQPERDWSAKHQQDRQQHPQEHVLRHMDAEHRWRIPADA